MSDDISQPIDMLSTTTGAHYYWQSHWDRLVDLFGRNEFCMGFGGTFILTFTVYWTVGIVYTIVDVTGKPSFMLKYKIQELTPAYPISAKLLMQALRQILINQIIIGLPFALLAHHLVSWRGYNLAQLPSFHRAIIELAFFVIVEEIAFYYSHRLLHNPKIYKYIHKRHHEWQTPIAITAIYCHPIEHIFSNLLPLFLGPFILGSHLSTSWAWYTLAIMNTLTDHSGYHLPLLTSPEAHDYHHLKFNENYGVLGILDRLHGTDTNFRKSKAFQRHRVFYSLRPIKDLYPDETNKSD
ncbi:fatty acid hydroxylase domain-containing protein 2-like isoform X1 [Oppia nitens]|uniref:fatty acid hydroxylase domain-containing protein 2-like isoform X1 n=1 Tax=Oppia nitens TaxID=1686743 RepID=UPI0023DCD2E6|nr:fatty acid hydroxylase domain-containing protein 2-like isoform X1 [Oppia nitens]